MKLKALVTITATKRDTYGNVYYTATVENLNNGKEFTTETPHWSNIAHILHDAFGGWDAFKIIESETGSARISSLPSKDCNLDSCHYRKDWKKALNSIGFRLPRAK